MLILTWLCSRKCSLSYRFGCVKQQESKGTSGNNGSVGVKAGDGRKAALEMMLVLKVVVKAGVKVHQARVMIIIRISQRRKKGSFDQMLVDGANAQNISVPSSLQPSEAGNPVAFVPPTNLNIGMDLWNASAAGSGSTPFPPNQNVPPPGMDERELKRQKRKQANRESARRSRLRKQLECEEIQRRVELLTNENHTLKDELQRVSEEYKKLTSENDFIKEELIRFYGLDNVSKIDDNNPATQGAPSGDDDGN